MPTNAAVRDRTLVAQRRMTQAWIDREGVPIALNRRPDYMADAAGSMIRPNVADITLAPVNRILVGLTMVGRGVNQQPERWHVTSQGERYKTVYVLVGTYDDDIQKGDYWINDSGDRLEVIFVHESRLYQVKAEIILLAP